MNLTGGTWHPYVYHISSIESPVVPVDLFQLFLVELALAERYSKNAAVSFFRWDLVCRPHVPGGDCGKWG